MAKLINNTYKSWVTSLIGLILIGAGLYSVLKAESTVSWTEALVIIVPGIGLLFCPDKLFTKLLGGNSTSVDQDPKP